ncbi:MAG: non-hydrolyzing UDP-N-acetylglucosamine 2-epimerase [Boseongicola sp.]
MTGATTLLPPVQPDRLRTDWRADARRFLTRPKIRVLLVFGTRPELIKLMPLIQEFGRGSSIELKTVMTAQHTDLVQDLLELWQIPVDYNLDVMLNGQSLNALCARVIDRMDAVLTDVEPDIVIVQGDTTTAFGAAFASWQQRIPVAHVEAGLRTATLDSPFPEEANRRLISKISTLHFAPTARNAETLISEGIAEENVVQTGNTIVDAIRLIRQRQVVTSSTAKLLESLKNQRIVVFTTHRREGFGEVLHDRLSVLSQFVKARPDVSVIFPVHPNPQVKEAVFAKLGDTNRVHLTEPLSYPDFLHCLAASWAIVSDSGGIQEEAPSLGKPLLILRSETERPESVECGIARLAGRSAKAFEAALEDLEKPGSWAAKVSEIPNPFGDGRAARRIVNALLEWHKTQQVEEYQGQTV